MGIESILYRLEPSHCEVGELNEYLRLHGTKDGDRDGAYVLSGVDYWIDVLVSTRETRVSVIHFRVAVTNPPSVTRRLQGLISGLHDRFGGQVTDPKGRGVGSEHELLDALETDFHRGRARFTEKFGEICLPVSADQVFAKLRNPPRTE